MNFKETTIEKEYIYKGKIIDVRRDKVELPNGNTSIREIVEHNGAVGIVAINKKNEIIMVRQYRKPFEEVLLEIPAGKIEGKEEPLECGKRELQEETGFKPLKMELMSTIYTSPGFTNERIYIFFCKDMEMGTTNYDSDEFIQTEYIPYERAVEMIYENKIKDAKTIAGILMAKKFI